MTRRAAAHDYTLPGIYHITLHVADGLGQPLGTVVGNLSAPDGSADAPRTALSPVGQMVEHELLHAIHAHYAMVTIQDYVITPEHLHFLAIVQDRIVSKNGKIQPLGHVLSGFKQGCNRAYWAMTQQQAKLAATLNPAPSVAAASALAPSVLAPSASAPSASAPSALAPSALAPSAAAPSALASSVPAPSASAPSALSVPGGFAAGKQPLFSPGYCDVMPVDAAQLATQRAYIAANPRSRLLRTSHWAQLSVQRGGIATALTPSALRGFLERECGTALTPEAWKELSAQLLMAPDGTITCDSFGDRRLLAGSAAVPIAGSGDPASAFPRLLPVVCHRKDAARFSEQKARCLDEAARGAVLVSARIAKGEQAIIDEALHHGFAVMLIADNGLPDRYHPSAARLDLCAAGRLLLLTPWQYKYRGKDEQVTVSFCKAMNCLAQALSRKKDSWWKTTDPPLSGYITTRQRLSHHQRLVT